MAVSYVKVIFSTFAKDIKVRYHSCYAHLSGTKYIYTLLGINQTQAIINCVCNIYVFFLLRPTLLYKWFC